MSLKLHPNLRPRETFEDSDLTLLESARRPFLQIVSKVNQNTKDFTRLTVACPVRYVHATFALVELKKFYAQGHGLARGNDKDC